MGGSHVTKRLEEVERSGVTFDPSTADEFRQHVEGDLHSSDRIDDSDRDDEDDAKRDTIKDNTNRSVSGEGSDTGATHGDSDGKDDGVPPFGHFLVSLHKTIVLVEVNLAGCLALP